MIELIGIFSFFLFLLLLVAIVFYWLGKRAGRADSLSALEDGEVLVDGFERKIELPLTAIRSEGTGNNQNENHDEQSLADENLDAVIPASNYILFNDDDISEFKSQFGIKECDIIISDLLGRGYIGSVYKAKIQNFTVSVKVMHRYNEDAGSEKKRFWEELKTIAAAGILPNVQLLLGFVESERGLLIITEYCDGGNLCAYIQSKKEMFEDNLRDSKDEYNTDVIVDDSPLCTFDLLSFAYQIANGMKHLTSVSILHNDLALRNVFVTGIKTIRIGDFGLAKRIETERHYNAATDETLIPIHHAAPEIFHNMVFSEKTEVWSFGVTLYELFSLGEKPYDHIHTHEALNEFLDNGGRLGEPEYCTRDIYKFMLECWDKNPDNRPNFSRCKKFFEEHFDQHKLSIRENVERKLEMAAEEQKRLRDFVRSRNQ